ncbi:MFS general substrate transporter [Trichoderma compactum]
MAFSHARSSSNDFTSTVLLDPIRPRKAQDQLDGTWLPDDGRFQPSTRLDDINSHSSYDFESQRPLTPVTPMEKTQAKSSSGPVTWMSLPRKDQLLILFLSRFVDFLQVASLQAYVFYQLKAFDDSLSDAQISQQAGVLQGCFTGAQVMTAILWGKAADASWCGRKWVLVIGLAGTAISCLGYGFATTFFWTAFWRAFGGAINGTVGTIRTMIAEITKEKKYQSRAFLILPMSFNVAGILGPIMGGMLADSSKTLPGLFGEKAVFGFQWIRDYPYALPSLINAASLSIVTVIVFLFLEETSRSRQHKFDLGLHLGTRLKAVVFGGEQADDYARVPTWEDRAMENIQDKRIPAEKPAPPLTRLPFRRLWTRNVLFTLLTGAFYDFHLGAFGNMWSLFLSTPRYRNPTKRSSEGFEPLRRYLPLQFTGGLGMPSSTIGVATSFLGSLGMLLQVTLYPPWFLFLFPVAYFVAPYLSILPSWSPPPEPASGGFIWVMARTFTLPESIILLSNCSPHPSVLGTIHGLGQSVSALFRTVGPVIGGWWYGYGLDIGMVAWGWWGVAAMSALACGTAMAMHDGSGHEVFLDGELDEME